MKQRILTALILLIVLVPILFLGGIAFNLTILLIGIMALKEMLDIRESKENIPFMMKLIAFACFIIFTVNATTMNGITYLLDFRSITFILFVLTIPIIKYHDNRV
jgi:phosphatidate cytidylyltransferase